MRVKFDRGSILFDALTLVRPTGPHQVCVRGGPRNERARVTVHEHDRGRSDERARDRERASGSKCARTECARLHLVLSERVHAHARWSAARAHSLAARIETRDARGLRAQLARVALTDVRFDLLSARPCARVLGKVARTFTSVSP